MCKHISYYYMSMANYQEAKVEFTKISFNVPKKLLEEFETIAFLNHYSRVEAFKEAMRQFVVDQTPDDYSNAEDMKNQWRQMFDAILEISEDPKYQKLKIKLILYYQSIQDVAILI